MCKTLIKKFDIYGKTKLSENSKIYFGINNLNIYITISVENLSKDNIDNWDKIVEKIIG